MATPTRIKEIAELVKTASSWLDGEHRGRLFALGEELSGASQEDAAAAGAKVVSDTDAMMNRPDSLPQTPAPASEEPPTPPRRRGRSAKKADPAPSAEPVPAV